MASKKHEKDYTRCPHINFLSVNTVVSQSFRCRKCECACTLRIHHHNFTIINFLGHVEVYENDSSFVLCYQNVRWLYVAVTNTLFVQICYPFQNLFVQTLRIALTECIRLSYLVEYLRSFNVLHHLENLAFERVLKNFYRMHNVFVF